MRNVAEDTSKLSTVGQELQDHQDFPRSSQQITAAKLCDFLRDITKRPDYFSLSVILIIMPCASSVCQSGKPR